MDKIEKALKKLSEKERLSIGSLLRQLQAGVSSGMDIKRLKGHADIYRIRKGDIRIIFQMKDGSTSILKIDRRREDTYRDF